MSLFAIRYCWSLCPPSFLFSPSLVSQRGWGNGPHPQPLSPLILPLSLPRKFHLRCSFSEFPSSPQACSLGSPPRCSPSARSSTTQVEVQCLLELPCFLYFGTYSATVTWAQISVVPPLHRHHLSSHNIAHWFQLPGQSLLYHHRLQTGLHYLWSGSSMDLQFPLNNTLKCPESDCKVKSW